jgi:hypothetical protein
LAEGAGPIHTISSKTDLEYCTGREIQEAVQREKIAWILDVEVHNGPRKSGDGGPCGHLAFSLFIVAEERGGLRPERPSLS